ncbi:MAG: hypothetical protein ACK4IR_08110, partial [Thermosynechococcus sp.]
NSVQGLRNDSPENLASNYVQDTGSNAKVDNSTNTGQIYLGCANTEELRPSFLNANRPKEDLEGDYVWLREDPFDPSSPIYVDKNGDPWAINYLTGKTRRYDYPEAYYTFNDSRALNGAADTRVNAVIVSGIVPSRPMQSYGGMHNFPRFIEGWGNLWIQGAFIQPNFSTQATGPFDQDQWEISPTTPSDNHCRNVDEAFNCSATSGELIQYYVPPTRRWGYDVGLQLAPLGPVARRMFTPSKEERNEYYKEMPAEDPYIKQLRCAQRPANLGSGPIDPTVTNCPASSAQSTR